MTARKRVALCAVVILVLLGLTSAASARPRVEMQLEGEPHAGLPFVIAVVAEGFDEPAPDAPTLAIDGARVELIDVTPNVRQFMQNINGRVTSSRTVTFVYRYKVTAPAGRYQIQPVTISQGDAKASTRPASFEVADVPTTRDMRVEMTVPDRQVWVGETFEAHLDWYIKRDARDQQLIVPLFDREDTFHVAAPPTDGKRVYGFEIGGRELELPYEQTREIIGGEQYVRLRFTALITPRKSGTLELPPAQAIARLKVGAGRDQWGFPSARYALYRASDQPRTIEVKPLPLQGRPDSFAGAVGASFSIATSAARTVVRVGDPIELSILIRGDAHLEALGLPPLVREGEGGLDPDTFELIDQEQTGTPVPDKNGKQFQATVRLTSPEVREVPALAFSYFDPERGSYETVRSEPIALSVAGSAMVGADQVVSAGGGPGAGSGQLSLVDADLSLSARGDTMDTVLSVGQVRPALYVLYALPLLLLAVRLWQVRTSDRRGEKSERKDAHQAVLRELEAARTRPARDTAGAITAALRNLARVTGRAPRDPVLERLETEAYAPHAAEEPLPAEVLEQARALADRWRQDQGAAGRGVTVAALLVLAAAGGQTGVAHASSLDTARDLYAQALAAEDREARTAAFARAAEALEAAVAENPRRPALLVDWGNALLGAGDAGRAMLAYRRAAHLDPGNERAARNITWLRAGNPDWLPSPDERGAVGTLFFWHDRLSRADKLVVGGVAFALAILLVTPWPTRRQRLLRRLAALPAAVWLAMTLSIVLERDRSGDAVVVADDVVLRAADSPGAPAAIDKPLPAGAEVRITATREQWVRISLPGGTDGWLPRDAVARVAP